MAGSKNLWIEVPASVAHANTAVLLTGDRFPDVFWDNVEADGADIIVYDNANNKLTRQLVAINTGAKTMELYVKSPSSATAKTYLRMEYDDAGGAEVNDFADYEDYHETYSARVAASADDCSLYWDGAEWVFSASATNLNIGYNTATLNKAGFGARFLTLNIARYSHICSAVMQVRASTSNALDDVNSYVYCEKSGTPATFTTLVDYQGRTHTTAKSTYDAVEDFVNNSDYNSVDFSASVQEVADSYSITNLVTFWEDHDNRSTNTDGRRRRAYPYDTTASYCPLLTVDYIPKLAYAVYTNDPITRTNVPRIARLMLITP